MIDCTKCGKEPPLSVELFSDEAFMQKFDYIHQNLVKANLVLRAQDYRYSSASYDESAVDEFRIITHHGG